MHSETLKIFKPLLLYEYDFTAYVADTIGRKTGIWDWQVKKLVSLVLFYC